MTMSVGLGRIVVDPNAPVLTRKALGVLSTPGLLVYDDALTIDETGRLVLRLKPNGGIEQSEDGLALSPVEKAISTTTIGIDSEVDPRSEAYDRDWNARLTGPAPNYIEGSIAVGAETFEVYSSAADEVAVTLPNAKVNITHRETQLRLSFDKQNTLDFEVNEHGTSLIRSISEDSPGIDIKTGDGINSVGGVKLNGGTTIESIALSVASFELVGGSFIALGLHVMWTQRFTITARPSLDHVTLCVGNATTVFPARNFVSFTAQITATNEVTIKVMTIGPVSDITIPFFVLIHQLGSDTSPATSLGSPTLELIA